MKIITDKNSVDNSIVKRNSFAKINIGLDIVNKRPDGFHEIETIFQEISLHDKLTFQHDENINLKCDDPRCPTNETNLVFKAAQALKTINGRQSGATIRINKNIPMGGGLGGGSSNAACAINSLSMLWNIPLSTDDKINIGARLGSDVPFFITGGTAFGKGRGEILESISIFSNYWGVLVTPGVSVSTKWAFSSLNFSLTKSLKKSNFGTFFHRSIDLEFWQTALKNNLEPVVFGAYPEFLNIKRLLYRHGAFYAQMSGSGSSLFGLYETKDGALKAQQAITCYKTFLFKPVTKKM